MGLKPRKSKKPSSVIEIRLLAFIGTKIVLKYILTYISRNIFAAKIEKV